MTTTEIEIDTPAIEDRRSVYERMVAVIDELPAIGKTQRNEQQKFMFRGHDDVMNALNPLLARHGVFIVPDVIERVTGERVTGNNKTMYEVNLHVRFTFYGLRGDGFTASGWGEGTDMGDKATSKAMTMAFKYVVAQAFALATDETSHSDADAGSAQETTRAGAARPPRAEGRSDPASFDPAKRLLEGAIAVTGEEAANALRLGLRDLDPTQDWPAIENYLAAHVYGVERLEGMTRLQWGEYWKRLANAVVRAQERGGGSGDFPPIAPEVLRDAFAWAFDGAVVAFSGAETASEDEPLGESRGEAERAQEAAEAAARDE